MMHVRAADLALLFMRLSLATVMGAHGLRRSFAWWGGADLAALARELAACGVPLRDVFGTPLPELVAFLVALGETGGAVLLVVGVLARCAAAAHAVIQLGALVLVGSGAGFFGAAGLELNLALLALAGGVTLLGPGTLAFRPGRVPGSRSRP